MKASTISVAIIIAALTGCASQPGTAAREDVRAVEHYNRTAQHCDRVLVVSNKKATKLRTGYDRDELLSAKCGME